MVKRYSEKSFKRKLLVMAENNKNRLFFNLFFEEDGKVSLERKLGALPDENDSTFYSHTLIIGSKGMKPYRPEKISNYEWDFIQKIIELNKFPNLRVSWESDA